MCDVMDPGLGRYCLPQASCQWEQPIRPNTPSHHHAHWDYRDDDPGDDDDDPGDDDPPPRGDQRSKRFNTDGHAILLSVSTLLS